MEDLGNILMGLTDHTTDPDRPFTGQPHTENGQRGATEIKGIRLRDLADCIVKAWIDAASHTIEDENLQEELIGRADDGTLNYNDVYKIDCGDVDPLALMLSVCCRVEKAMGIFPNVPRLQCEESESETT
jgi:hypothetical protein